MAEQKTNIAGGTTVMKNDDEVIILNDDNTELYMPDVASIAGKKAAVVNKDGNDGERKKDEENGKDNKIEVDENRKSAGETPGEGEGTEDDSLLPFIEGLQQAGVLPNFNKANFDGSLDGVFEAVGNEISLGVKAYKDSLPRTIKDMIENYEENVPLDKLINVKSRQIEIKNVDEDNLRDDTSKQKKIISDFLRLKGFKETKIDSMVAKYEEIGELFDESKEALTELKEHYTKEEERIRKQAQADKKASEDNAVKVLESIKGTIDKTMEIIPGTLLNKQVKDKIYESMTDIIDYTDRGVPVNNIIKIRSKDPVKFDIILNYLASFGVFEGKWDTLKGVFTNNISRDILDKTKTHPRENGRSVSDAGTSVDSSAEILKGLKKFISNR